MPFKCALSFAAPVFFEFCIQICPPPPHEYWPPTLKARHKADLAQAQYSLIDIMDLSTNWVILCSRCLQWGHRMDSCQAHLVCISCSAPDHKAVDFPLHGKHQSIVGPKSIQDNKIKHAGYHAPTQLRQLARRDTKPTVRCTACGIYGHVQRSCHRLQFAERWKWRPKKF